MRELHDLVVGLAVEAADLARTRRAEGVDVAASKTSLVDIVTEADREVERLVVDRILAARPDDGILGEEGTSVAGTSGLTWVIDPIDGTVNYFYDIPAYAVSIALVEGEPDPTTWRALSGAVVNGATGERFEALRGGGARLDGRPIRVAEAVAPEVALVGTGFGYDAERRMRQGAVLAGLLGEVRDVRRGGSAALDLCWVATGRLNAYYERGLNPWDMAAGALVVQEAGGVVQGLGGGPASSGFLLAAAPGLVDELDARLGALGADRV
ncbi:inositol monophosphatase family protein [Agrococcus sp. SL85]|uniref:inositol monophosphatase family protein n=1 Tax=Agrococcus sp. SL85 TaxID=2995141 RepID=UPI00226CE00E|nr:inositol monophosphatase family protein [Agrococcus sp. SL85]WAC67372.1 inositol monophosphatase family protein [Agrococcus sp. SL85]